MQTDQNIVHLTIDEVYSSAMQALLGCGVLKESACSVATSIKAAEADGMHSHGLMRLPAYCQHVLSGKVDGRAIPTMRVSMAGALRVDAAHGFAHPAIDLGMPRLAGMAKKQGIAMMAVVRSYNAGAMGYHVERLASDGVVALAFANAPACIAPWGGMAPLFGTNPIAFSAPGAAGPALVIDQACSIVARGEVVRKAQAGEQLPEGWALDSSGSPTQDPRAALEGTMLPIAGPKGVNLAWIVEILASAMTGATPSHQASSIIDDEGGPPGIGQMFIALHPAAFLPGLENRMAGLCEQVRTESRARLPGEGRWRARHTNHERGIQVSRRLYEQITSFY